MFYSKRLITFLVFAGLQLASFLLSPLAPISLGWENGVLENLQVGLLLIGGVWAIYLWKNSQTHRVKTFWLLAAPIWFLMSIKELGWGAVLYTPLGWDPVMGPQFSSSVLWYKPAVAPLLIGFCLLVAWISIQTNQIRTLRALHQRRDFPATELIIFCYFMLCSAAAEGHMGADIGLAGGIAQVYEEFVETLAYIALLVAQYRISMSSAIKRMQDKTIERLV